MTDGFVGMFDSGWGGLSVAGDVWSVLPAESLLYVADHAYCPYGERHPRVIRSRACRLALALVGRGAKAIVVACNTASALAIDDVRSVCGGIPIVGVVPAVKPAAAASRSGVIAVLATPRTAVGDYLGRLIGDHALQHRVLVIPAPGLVDLVEAGEIDGPRVESIIGGLLAAPLREGADQVVLGCTHFPFLRPVIELVVGPDVTVVDSGFAITRQLPQILTEAGLLAPDGPGFLRLATTGDQGSVEPIVSLLLGERVAVSPFAEFAAGASLQ